MDAGVLSLTSRNHLSQLKTRYSTFDRELLAAYLAVKHFRYFVEGREFHSLTDHKPLVYAIHTLSSKHSPHQARHLDFIAQFTSDIRHVKGNDNVPADALSRVEANAVLSDSPPVIDFRAMAAAQESDPDVLQMRSSSLTLASMPLAVSDSTILCDTSTGVARPLVPVAFRRAVFESLHSLSHPGIRATQCLVTTLRLASHQRRHSSMDSQLSQVPTRQGSAAYSHTVGCIPKCCSPL